MSGRNLELPPVSVFVPAGPGRQGVAVLFPPQCATYGYSKLLRRAMDSHTTHMHENSNTAAPIIDVTEPARVTPHALRLCCEYLEHYSTAQAIIEDEEEDGDVPSSGPSIAAVMESTSSHEERRFAAEMRRRDQTPTILPTPLTGPIEQLLSSWENLFISKKLLRNNGDPWEHQDLIAVLHAAQFLEIPTLESLCSAWCGSQITKMCTSTKNCFEAAEMVRKFFHIEKDWTPEEEECLRIENDWPEGEE